MYALTLGVIYSSVLSRAADDATCHACLQLVKTAFICFLLWFVIMWNDDHWICLFPMVCNDWDDEHLILSVSNGLTVE